MEDKLGKILIVDDEAEGIVLKSVLMEMMLVVL